MNDFDDMMVDTIDIEKINGERLENLKASVGEKIHVNRGDILIEPNDVIVRKLSNGGKEKYRVIDPGFYEEWEGIESHYQIRVEKLGLTEIQRNVTTININGNNAKVNNNSIDNSINKTINNILNNDIHSELNKLITKLDELEEHHRREYSSVIAAIKEESKKEEPNKSILKSFLGALPSVATISTNIDNILEILS